MLVLGHRGSPEKEIENTIPSFLAALDDGADGVELDVHLSSDSQVIVFHDADLRRLAGVDRAVGEMTAEELRSVELRAGDLPQGQIPTLEEVMDTLPDRTIVNVELKGPGTNPDGLEDAVGEVMSSKGAVERCIISSFNPVRLRRMKLLEPGLGTAFLHSGSVTEWPARTTLRVAGRISGLHPQSRQVDEQYVASARSVGRFVNVWTVNEEEDIRRLLSLGVDGIISDRPALVRSCMSR
jgi:glycerophosphoryl diester phosphodiesterase